MRNNTIPGCKMADLEKILKQLKTVPRYSDLSFNDIDKALASKFMIRYRTLSLVYTQFNELGMVMKPAPIDVLSLKPIKVDGEICSIDGIVTAAFARAAHERDIGHESVVDILRLHKLSKPIDFSAIDDHTTLEFLSRIPSNGELRTFRMAKLANEARVYFCMNRYMILVNLGEGTRREDQNYFITIFDLGSMFQNYFNGVESYVLFNPTIVARFEKIPYTGKPRYVNTKLMLWDTVRQPARYYWFVRGDNIKRSNYTFEIKFSINQQTRFSTIDNNDWGFYKRIFGIVITAPEQLRKSA